MSPQLLHEIFTCYVISTCLKCSGNSPVAFHKCLSQQIWEHKRRIFLRLFLKVKDNATFKIKAFFEGILNSSLVHIDRGYDFPKPSEYFAYRQRYFFIGLCHKSQCHGSLAYTSKLKNLTNSAKIHTTAKLQSQIVSEIWKKEKPRLVA